METREQLIAYYENNLKKVIKEWEGQRDGLGNDGAGYIKFAREQLEAVKNGRNW